MWKQKSILLQQATILPATKVPFCSIEKAAGTGEPFVLDTIAYTCPSMTDVQCPAGFTTEIKEDQVVGCLWAGVGSTPTFIPEPICQPNVQQTIFQKCLPNEIRTETCDVGTCILGESGNCLCSGSIIDATCSSIVQSEETIEKEARLDCGLYGTDYQLSCPDGYTLDRDMCILQETYVKRPTTIQEASKLLKDAETEENAGRKTRMLDLAKEFIDKQTAQTTSAVQPPAPVTPPPPAPVTPPPPAQVQEPVSDVQEVVSETEEVSEETEEETLEEQPEPVIQRVEEEDTLPAPPVAPEQPVQQQEPVSYEVENDVVRTAQENLERANLNRLAEQQRVDDAINSLVEISAPPTTLVYNPPESSVIQRPPIPEGLEEAATITRGMKRQDAANTSVCGTNQYFACSFQD